MQKERAVELLGFSLGCNLEEKDDTYYFRNTGKNLLLEIKKVTIEKLVDEINGKSNDVDAPLWLYDRTSMELFVRERNSIVTRQLAKSDLPLRRQDDENGIFYEISEASDAYLLFFLDQLDRHLDIKRFFKSRDSFKFSYMGDTCHNESCVFEFLKRHIQIRTIQIKCGSETSREQMSKLVNSFLFQLAFKTTIALVPQKELDILLHSKRISIIRQNSLSEIEPPRSIYEEDLIYHYLLAISTSSPVVKYISYYHVLEHFYNKIVNDNLIKDIQEVIEESSFSSQNKQDVEKIISIFKESAKNNREEKKLYLTLEKFIDISDLEATLNEVNPQLVDYYKEKEVPFTKETQVDLRAGNREGVLKNLAKRIYKTRNAIVHSKDGESEKYNPFTDDHALNMELPLLQLLSEQIILKNSEAF